MRCRACNSEHPPGRKFCTSCGAPLAQACPNCGAPGEPGARFCGECGTPLGAGAAPAPVEPEAAAAADPGQRRFVTVLFADLVGFTPFSESRDPEEVRAMLTRYFDRAREITERFGGVVDKFIGDAVMAVWGATQAREDDAERGVRAGLELVDSVAGLGDELGIPELSARVGVMSGETSVGSGGNEQGLVVGDLVNTASRLQSVADPGAVLVGATTRDLARAAVEFEDLGSVPVKGKQIEIDTWKALRVVAGRHGEGRVDGLLPPFVGREGELRMLKDLLHRTSEERRSHLVSIVGEAGIGKSRLVAELLHYVDGLVEDVYWHQGRSPSYGDGLTFWALGEMVRRRCGIAESDDEHRTRTKLRTAIAEYVGDADDRSWLEPRLAGLLGVAPLPEGDRAELFAAWRSFFHHVAQRGTVVMVFEDLHWADPGLVDFVEELAARAADRPIVVLTLARPELLQRRPGWAAGRADAVTMHLGPLPPDDMVRLVRGMVPGVPDDLAGRVVERAGGVPLYAVEIVRMLVSRGLVVVDGDRFLVEGDVAALPVPDSLHGVIGARIDQLDPDDRALLQDAAVLGQSFTLDALADLHGADPIGLEERLTGLVRRQLLEADTDPRSPERGQYRFLQSLIREVAHARLSRADRRAKHLHVAQRFEASGEAETAAAVAAHYVAALEATTDAAEAARLGDRAVGALRTAAERAASLHSHEQVVTLAKRAIEITDEPAALGAFWMRAAESAHALLDRHAEDYARSAIAAFADTGDSDGSLAATRTLARILNDTNRSLEALALLEPAARAAEGTRSAEYARSAAETARSQMLAERSAQGDHKILEWTEKALIVAEELDLVTVITEAMITRGTVLTLVGRQREGSALLEAALRLATEHDLGNARWRALNNLSYLAAADHPAASLEYSLERLEYARRIGEPRMLLQSLFAVSSVLATGGRWEESRAVVAEMDLEHVGRDLQIPVEDLERQRRMWTGEPEWAERRFRELLDEYVELVGLSDYQLEANLAWESCIIDLLNGRAEQAYERGMAIDDGSTNLFDAQLGLYGGLYLRDADKLAAVVERLETKPFRGRRVDWLRTIADAGRQALRGDPQRAATRIRQAIDLMDGLAVSLDTAATMALAARVLGPDGDTAVDLAREAAARFAAVGATTGFVLLPEWFDAAEQREAVVR